jgi:hypothetical protein
MNKFIATLLAVLTTVTAAGCFDPNRSVEITVGIETPYGGVFADGTCSPVSEYAEILDGLVIATYPVAVNVELPELTWKKTQPDLCEATFSAVLSSEETYKVTVPGLEIGEIKLDSIESGVASIKGTVKATRSISGTLRLYQQATYKAVYPSGLAILGYSREAEHFEEDSSTYECEGVNAYRKIYGGGTIYLNYGDGTSAALATLTKGTNDNIVIDELTNYCDFQFTFEKVPFSIGGYEIRWDPNASGLRVEVGQVQRITGLVVSVAFPENKAKKVSPGYCRSRVGPEWDFTNPQTCWAPSAP